jgi:sugar/nucleoside kinase (ribokinase family)
MSVLVVGSVAVDTIETPFGKVESVLGGSAVYFSLAASFFSRVRLVGVVGEDFPPEHRQLLEGRSIDLDGLTVAHGRTFRWEGVYRGQMNEAETRQVQLNVFEDFRPVVPDAYKGSEFVFLANASPHTQLYVRRQVPAARFVMADTMNLWIEMERPALIELLRNVDALILNDAEARQLSGDDNLLRAARWVCEQGPGCCVIKKAEHGALLMGPEGVFVLPGFPTENVIDPTGAGDSFAGGLMGYAAASGDPTPKVLRKALAYGTVMASFAIEDFATVRLRGISRRHIEQRLKEFIRATHLT